MSAGAFLAVDTSTSDRADVRIRLLVGASASSGKGYVMTNPAHSTGEIAPGTRVVLPCGAPKGKRPGSGGCTLLWREIEPRTTRGTPWPVAFSPPTVGRKSKDVERPLRSMSSKIWLR